MFSIEDFCESLSIDPNERSQENVDKLIRYCQENISQDAYHSGNLNEQFNYYYELIKYYLEVVLPNTNKYGPMDKVKAFDDQTVFEFLIRRGFDQCIQKLSLSQSDLNQFWGLMSPLHISASCGYIHTTTILLNLGANPNIKNPNGESPLEYVLNLPIIHDEHLKNAKMKVFIILYNAYPALLKQPLLNDNTVLHKIAAFGYHQLAKKILSQYPGYTTAANNQGHMPIHSALLNRRLKVSQILLAAGPVDKMLDHNGQGPLHYAASHCNIDFLRLCHTNTTDINMIDIIGRTPLMLAAYNGNLEALQYLLQLGAKLDCRDKYGLNALELALQQEQIEIIEHLLKFHIDESSLSEQQRQTLVSLRNSTLAP